MERGMCKMIDFDPIPYDEQVDSLCDICYTDDFLHTVECPRFDAPRSFYSDADEMESALDYLLECE